MQSSFFWRLFASYFLLVLVTTVLIGWMVDRRMSGALEDSHEASLRDKTLYLEPFALRVFSGEAGGAEERIGALARASGTRLTLIRADGVVVADSDEDVARMENHANRPEVLAAHGAPFGISRRRSATVGYEMLYVARVLPTGDVVRVALPLRQVHEQVVALRGSIAAVALLALLVSLGLGLIVVRRINRPIAEMTRVAEELRAGVYTRRVRSRTDDELGVLADTLNRLGEEIARRIATISEDRTRLGAVLAGMAESVVAVDREDRVLFCNAAAAKLFEVDPERSVGQPFGWVSQPFDLGGLLREARETGAPVNQEIAVERGERRLALEIVATPFESGEPDESGDGLRTNGRERPAPTGPPRGVVVVLHDITDLRALERVRRDFVANVSHELKTPLTSIKGYVETLLDDEVELPVRNRFLEKIRRNTDRLGHLVSDLLSLSRIESQGGPPELEPIDWSAMLAEAGRRYEDAARLKRIRLEVRPPHEAIRVLGDREAIIEILDNLLDNAIKYTPAEGRIRLVLSKGEDSATLTVEDTGAGIPEQDLERIFERFYRVDKARSRELGGSGLGLSIVKHLVQSMRGEVGVRSRLGEGSCFTVRLPLAGSPAKAS